MAHSRTQSAPFAPNPFDDVNFLPFDPLSQTPEDDWVQFDCLAKPKGNPFASSSVSKHPTAPRLPRTPSARTPRAAQQKKKGHHRAKTMSSFDDLRVATESPRNSSHSHKYSSPVHGRTERSGSHRRVERSGSDRMVDRSDSDRRVDQRADRSGSHRRMERSGSDRKSHRKSKSRSTPKAEEEDRYDIPVLSSPHKPKTPRSRRHRKTKSHGDGIKAPNDRERSKVQSPTPRKKESSKSRSKERLSVVKTKTPRSKKGHRRVKTAPVLSTPTADINPSDYSPPAGQHFWAPLAIPSALPTTGFSPTTDEAPGINVIVSDRSSDDDEYHFDSELDTWTQEPAVAGQKKRPKPSKKTHQPTVRGVSAKSTKNVDHRFNNLQFGIKVVDTDKWIFPPDKILFVQRGYFKGEFLDHIDFVFESMLSHNSVIVGIKIFKHGPNMFMTPAGENLNYKKHKYHKWRLDPGERLHCMTAERDDSISSSLRSNKMGFSYLIGYKWKNKWHWG